MKNEKKKENRRREKGKQRAGVSVNLEGSKKLSRELVKFKDNFHYFISLKLKKNFHLNLYNIFI